VVVPLDERRDAPEAAHGAAVEPPHGGHDRGIVRVEEVRSLVAVPGQVDLPHARGRDAVDVFLGREAVVDGAHVDVVHVEQDATVGALRDGGEELPTPAWSSA